MTDDDHLSFDELAELAEGLLGDEQSAVARAHLADCTQCQERAASLDTATAMLHDLPPVTMPADVAARLEQALAGATQDDAEPEPAAAGSGSSRNVIPDVADIRQHRRWGRPSGAATAAAAVFVLLVAGISIAHFSGTSSNSDDAGSSGASTSSAASSAGQPIGTNTTTDFAELATGTLYDAGHLTNQVDGLLATVHGSTGSAQSSGIVNGPASGSGSAAASASSSSVPLTVPSASGNAPVPAKPSAAAGETFGPDKRALSKAEGDRSAISHAKLLTCAAALTGTPGAVPLAVDFARWTGKGYHAVPSIIVVFNGTTAGTLSVYVVAPSCDPNQIRTYSIVSRSG